MFPLLDPVDRAPLRRSGRPRHSRSRPRCRRMQRRETRRLATTGPYAFAPARCAIVCAAFGARACPPAGAVKRETGGGHPPGLCCPRNGTPPARRAFSARAHAAHDATARLLRVGRPRPGKRPARIPADARGERCARRTPGPRGTDCVRVSFAYRALMARSRPLRAGCFHSAMHRHSAGRLHATRSPLFPSSPRFAPCRPR